MANPMTGGFDAVVQLSIRSINGLLATLHQNGSSTGAALKLLHNARFRIPPPSPPVPALETFNDWVLTMDAARRPGPKPPMRDSIVAAAPPGVAKRLQAAFLDLDDLPELEQLPVRGIARIQLSTVTFAVPAGSASEVEVSCSIRAEYTPDPQTTTLPREIHGTVKAVFVILRTGTHGAVRLLIRPSADDEKIAFTPQTTLSSADTDRITTHVRQMLRAGFRLPPVDLPRGFPFSVFRGVGSLANVAIALPVRLPGGSGGGTADAITQSIVGMRGFAFGVSGEHVLKLLQPTIETIRQQIRDLERVFNVPVIGEVRYTFAFLQGPDFTFRSGGIEISGRIAVTGDGGPDGTIFFKVTVALSVSQTTQQVSVVRVGSATVDVDNSIGGFLLESKAASIINAQIDAALPQISAIVDPPFTQAKASLAAALQSFERSATVSYEEAEITTDGVIVRGDISTAPRIAPIVSFKQIADRHFDAFETWVPGGAVNAYHWSWVEHPPGPLGMWTGEVKTSGPVSDAFRFGIPLSINRISRVCLRIVGRRFVASGFPQAVIAGELCEVDEPSITLSAPSWWEPMMMPIWKPEIPQDQRLRDAIAGHISVHHDRAPRGPAHPAVIFFPDWTSPAPFDPLARAAAMRSGKDAPAVVIVLPTGAFDSTRRELEARLQGFPDALGARLEMTEDIDGGWTKGFDVRELPALFVMNARRQFAWSAYGEIDPRAVAAALDEHAVSTRKRTFVPAGLRVSIGDRAPDIYFKDDDGEERAIHRLLGRQVFLSFCHSSSAASVAELVRLQALADADPRTPPFIVGFDASASLETFDALRKSHGVSFALVHDREQRAARAYGVRCWPTTIEINEDGRIASATVGLQTDRDGSA